MVQPSMGWQLDVDRGPGCVIIRPHHLELSLLEAASLVEDIWEILDKHLTYRVVLDMDEVDQLTSRLLGQLIALRARVATRGGAVRLCGLSPANESVLDTTHLKYLIPCYGSRTEAIRGSMAHRPAQPR